MMKYRNLSSLSYLDELLPLQRQRSSVQNFWNNIPIFFPSGLVNKTVQSDKDNPLINVRKLNTKLPTNEQKKVPNTNKFSSFLHFLTLVRYNNQQKKTKRTTFVLSNINNSTEHEALTTSFDTYTLSFIRFH